MNLVFVDTQSRQNLLPLTYTRPTSQLRCGILTLEEKWKFYLHGEFSHLTEVYLQEKYPLSIKDDNWLINPLALPNKNLIEEIHYLDQGTALYKNDKLVAARISKNELEQWQLNQEPILEKTELKPEVQFIEFPWHLFQNNKEQISHDYELLIKGRNSSTVHESTTLIGSQIFIEEGAQVINCSLNALDGPIYIGKNASVQDGAFIKGPFALCEGATVNMGAKIRDGSTIGPYSKVGGEINNSILIGYSNKGHDGFLGNSVLGEWCNLGADTNTSNLKNNYSNVRVHSITENKAIDTQSQFCGLIMGDHSKCGINTMFNTGTVVGVSANIYGGDFPPKYIPSFAWGGANGFVEYKFDKALEVAERVMSRRKKELDITEKDILNTIFENTKEERK
jgi:UDP-N-acetylglucosamine diphosphorylase/glucosamine-1-phosphate N-acetyltransferase